MRRDDGEQYLETAQGDLGKGIRLAKTMTICIWCEGEP